MSKTVKIDENLYAILVAICKKKAEEKIQPYTISMAIRDLIGRGRMKYERN